MIPVILLVVMGLAAGVLLTIAAKVLFVPVDETAAALGEALPGANCGACGYAGCADYAEAMAADRSVSPNLCPVGGAEVAKALAEILGVEAGAASPIVAFVRCQGSNANTDKIMEYQGVATCEAAQNFYGGGGSCSYGCTGLGDCVRACAYDAIRVIDGVAVVDRDACVGCGLCAKACPKNIILMGEKKKVVYVACQSKAQGAKARKACKVACIGCGKCKQVCKFDSITVENNLATIDLDKCKNCGACEKVCPTKAIINFRLRNKPPAPKPAPKPVEASKPEAPKPAEAPKSEASKETEPAKPEALKPDDTIKTEASKPADTVKPEASKPAETAKPEAPKAEAPKVEDVKPEPEKSEAKTEQ